MIVSVIVPTFNRAHYLGPALKSIPTSAGGLEVEIVVVDDGSTDDTPQVVEQYLKEGYRLQYIQQANSGIAVARNAGLENLGADTEFVTFLDSDDVFPDGALAAQLEVLQSDHALDLVYGRMVMTDQIDPFTLAPSKEARQLALVGIHLSCALLRRSVIDRVGMFDTDFVQAEDTDYLLRVFESGAKFRQTDTVCLYYRRHPQNVTKDIAESRRFFARAIQKSMVRRRRDPSIKLVKPEFAVQQVGTMEFY